MANTVSGFYRNAVWAFLGLLLALAGFGNAVDPTKFAPNIVLDHTSTILITFYGVLTLLGGLLVIYGAGFNRKYVERAGWQLILPSIALVFVVFVLTGTWNRVSVDITYLAFLLVIMSRISQLKTEIAELEYAKDALLKLRARR